MTVDRSEQDPVAAFEPFREQMRALLPAGARLLDAHTHLGHDEDGRSLELPALLAMLDDAGVAAACVFPLHDPERRPAYRVPNDRLLALARQAPERLHPFCRLDPADGALAEGRRCIEAGARGIKLHPRAQEFSFSAGGSATELEAIFALAGEAGVPLIIHAGRGMPPIAEGLADLALSHPDTTLILAHAAICDQELLTSRLTEHPAVLYDSSCFFALDVLSLLSRVPPERVVFGSDPPYGRPFNGLYVLLRACHRAGLSSAEIEAIAGGTMTALMEGRPLAAAGPVRGSREFALTGAMARLHSYLAMAGQALFSGAHAERVREGMELALAICRDPDPGAEAPALETIGNALRAAQWQLTEADSIGTAMALLHLCLALAGTSAPTG